MIESSPVPQPDNHLPAEISTIISRKTPRKETTLADVSLLADWLIKMVDQTQIDQTQKDAYDQSIQSGQKPAEIPGLNAQLAVRIKNLFITESNPESPQTKDTALKFMDLLRDCFSRYADNIGKSSLSPVGKAKVSTAFSHILGIRMAIQFPPKNRTELKGANFGADQLDLRQNRKGHKK
jgi:hypothetical protein